MASSTVYFLGAGTSAEAGVPLTGSLLKLLVTRAESAQSTELTQFIKRFGFHHAADGESISDLINFVNSSIRENQPLDDYFTVECLRRLRDKITVELSFVIGEAATKGQRVKLPPDAELQPDATKLRIQSYVKHFVRQLKTRRRTLRARLGPGDVVITTNYDINIDAALFELVYADESGADRGGSDLTDVYLGSEFRDPDSDEYALSAPKATVDFFKLHGSLNWLHCPRCLRIFVAAFGFSVRYLDDLEGPSTSDERLCYCGYHPLEAVLVAPSSTQEIANFHLRSIWMNAYQALEGAERVVISGYSLPAEDLAIRSLFHRAVDARRKMSLPKAEIFVVDLDAKDPGFQDRFRRLFGSNVQFKARKFGRWAAKL